MSTEYYFFDAGLRDRFIGFVTSREISSSFRADPMNGFVVDLPEALSQEIEAVIELEYDSLLELQRDLADAEDDVDARDVMGVTVTLPDGQTCQVRLPATYARRLIEHFSFEEIHALVSVIAHNVAHPVAGPLCRKA
jgi:hypothetical protein